MNSHPIDGLLILVRLAATDESLDRLHAGIENDIEEALRTVERANLGTEDYLELVMEEESASVEELLGLAFVAGQVFINNVRSRVAVVSQEFRRAFNRSLSFVADGDKKAFCVLKIGDSIRTDSPYTAAQLINAIANYWKHEGDWPTCERKERGRLLRVWDTARMEKIAQSTVKIVCSIGMTPFSGGNLRKAVDYLEVTDYRNLSPIRQKLKQWASLVYKTVSGEVARQV